MNVPLPRPPSGPVDSVSPLLQTHPDTSPGRAQNGFDLIRLLAALTVMWGHGLLFMGIQEPWLFGRARPSDLAVLVFFAISGYLVTDSWLRDPRVLPFLARRALRIFPGLIATLAFTALVIGPLFTVLPVADYFTRTEPWLYIVANATTYAGRDVLLDVFRRNPFPDAVNAPLWTLRYELACYLGLAFLGFSFRPARRLAIALAMASLCTVVAWYMWVGPMHGLRQMPLPALWRISLNLNSYLPYFGVFFLVGALMRMHRGGVPLHPAIAVVLLLACWLERQSVYFMPLFWIAVPYTAILCGLRMPARWCGITKGQDLSYGLYIFACPIQQAVVAVGVPLGWGWITTWLASILLTGIAAWLSWRHVEKPALNFKVRLAHAGRAAQTG